MQNLRAVFLVLVTLLAFNVAHMSADQTSEQQQLEVVRAELQAARTEIAGLKSENAGLKSENMQLKSEVVRLKSKNEQDAPSDLVDEVASSMLDDDAIDVAVDISQPSDQDARLKGLQRQPGYADFVKSCYLTYCNAHNGLKNGLCGGNTCASDHEFHRCKNHWHKHGKSHGLTPDPERCTQHTDWYRGATNSPVTKGNFWGDFEGNGTHCSDGEALSEHCNGNCWLTPDSGVDKNCLLTLNTLDFNMRSVRFEGTNDHPKWGIYENPLIFSSISGRVDCPCKVGTSGGKLSDREAVRRIVGQVAAIGADRRAWDDRRKIQLRHEGHEALLRVTVLFNAKVAFAALKMFQCWKSLCSEPPTDDPHADSALLELGGYSLCTWGGGWEVE
jgi:cell division protein FtsB